MTSIGEGCLSTGGSAFRGVCLLGWGWGLHPGGLPTGVGGLHPGEGGWADPPPELEKRAVRILLYCFLVQYAAIWLAVANQKASPEDTGKSSPQTNQQEEFFHS